MKRVLCLLGLATLVGCASGASSTGAVASDYIPFIIGTAGVISGAYSYTKYKVSEITKAKWYGAIGIILFIAGIGMHIAS